MHKYINIRQKRPMYICMYVHIGIIKLIMASQIMSILVDYPT